MTKRGDLTSAAHPSRSTPTERVVEAGGWALVTLFIIGWGWSLTHTRAAGARGVNGLAASTETTPAARVAAALTNRDAPTAAYLTAAALDEFTGLMLRSARGASGQLRAQFGTTSGGVTPDTLPEGAQLAYAPNGDTTRLTSAPAGSGVWGLVLRIGNAIRPVANFSVIQLVPFSAKQAGKVGGYYIGTWPAEKGIKGPAQAPAGEYGNPTGFIQVTQANETTHVSTHFRLGDFLTHDQPNVWPKYLVLQPKLVDKLELVLSELEKEGYDTHGVHVMSGFRTPQYNAGGGNTEGRAELSRHMFGDASDIFIDDDGDGQMDDLNHDGKITIADARVILAAVDKVEAAHPELIGGAGTYVAAPGHGPFIHIDTRGYRARW